MAAENYRLKATVRNVSKPTITRTLSVPKTSTFHKFHEALQIAFGWTSSHFYKFELLEPPLAGRKRRASHSLAIVILGEENFVRHIFPNPPLWLEPLSTESTTLQEVLDDPAFAGKLIVYHYDFGDGWEHSIEMVGTEETEGGIKCLDGSGHGVAEDCGGVRSWENLKSIYKKVSKGADRDKLSSDDREGITWFEEICSNGNKSGLDPNQWSKDDVNARLALL